MLAHKTRINQETNPTMPRSFDPGSTQSVVCSVNQSAVDAINQTYDIALRNLFVTSVTWSS